MATMASSGEAGPDHLAAPQTRAFSTRSRPHPSSPSSNSHNPHAHQNHSRRSSSNSNNNPQAQLPQQHYHQHQRHRDQQHRHSSSSSSRPVQDILPQDDYETSNLANNRKRSSSKDRPSTASRSAEHSRSHRPTSSHRSPAKHNQRHHPTAIDMAPPTAATSARNGDPTTATHTAPEPHVHSSTKPAKSRTTIPTQSGKWILGKTIGQGSMGKVKLARKEDGSEQVACKIIPRGSTDDGHQSRAEKERADQSKEIRTAREAAIVTLLSHPHICGLRDVVRTNYHWYMLFEFVNGGQMLDYIISHGKLKEKQARKFSRQIASALDYCHRNSIVHRDLKIENILISKTGDIKIIDFGLSNLFAPRGHLKTFCGSLYFAAPELLNARAYTGPEVDVWSFGIVLYVLVCGKVPFDDQSMPALHAKIKKGAVDYPTWLSNECKHLLSRMLVTEPKQRATMQEVINHPWMIKGFNGPPENYLPPREPLTLPLDNEVIEAMQGFNFGSPEAITAQLTKTIESDEYQRAIRMYQRERDVPAPSKDGEKRRGFGFDFYKRRNSQNSRDTLTAPSSEALQLGNDPMNAFSPALSIYYLVREKQERARLEEKTLAPGVATREKEKERNLERERERERDRERDREREKERERDREREREQGRDREHNEKTVVAPPELSPPQAAHTNPSAYEMPGEKPTGGRSRQRSRTHGEDEAPDAVKQSRLAPPEPKVELAQRKEGTAAGILRRFSTRRRKDPERLDKDRSHPPTVQVHSPADGAPLTTRKSFSIRRSRREMEDQSEPRIRSGSSQPQHRELLSPPVSAGGRDSRKAGLNRSTSVNSAVPRRRENKEPPPTSGSDQSIQQDQPLTSPTQAAAAPRSASMRTKSLGHARRESIQRRRQRREAAQEANVPEETDMEQEQSGVSTDRLDSSDLAKPVFLKGLFSVSTTSGKSVPAIRADIRRVLKQLNVEFTEIKGGFSCRHAPSIDLNKIQDVPTSPNQPTTPGHRRRFSFGGLMRGDERDRDEVRDMDRGPTTPRTPHGQDRDRSYSNSEASVDSIPRRHDGASRGVPGETSTQVQSDLGGSMVLEFEIFIVKVPLFSLHGVQFKRMGGNTWQFKSMADQILKELRL